MDGPA
jgi:hypothetical protein